MNEKMFYRTATKKLFLQSSSVRVKRFLKLSNMKPESSQLIYTSESTN